MEKNGKKMEKTVRPWGNYKVVGKTKIITVNPNQKLSLQYHNKKDEYWQILSGTGKVTIGKEEISFIPDQTFNIPRGTIHRIEAKTEVKFIEISTGEVLEDDIIRIKDEYGRIKGKKVVVVVSGYFDPLHIGHLEYLQLSKELGDKLIVILNSDFQATLKKGKSFMKEEERKEILETLPYVDEVFISIDQDSSVRKSLEKIQKREKINIFTQGGDRFNYEIPEKEICDKYGIKMLDSLGKKIQSSSWLINGIK